MQETQDPGNEGFNTGRRQREFPRWWHREVLEDSKEKRNRGYLKILNDYYFCHRISDWYKENEANEKQTKEAII